GSGRGVNPAVDQRDQRDGDRVLREPDAAVDRDRGASVAHLRLRIRRQVTACVADAPRAAALGRAPTPFGTAGFWGMIVALWSTGRGIDAFGRRRPTRALGTAAVATLLLAACGNNQSPTDPARLSETRRLDADAAVKTPDVVDALFLGSGPLIPRDGSVDCPLQGFWSGYPRGASVRVRVASRVPGSAQAGIAAGIGALSGATSSAILVNMEVTPEIDPQPGVNEVTVTEVALPRAAGCSSDAGCVQYRFAGRGLLMSTRIVEPRGQSVSAYV